MWPGYSITAHAAQGATIEPCIIDLTDVPGSTTIDHASNYVLLSRVTALKNLLILREFDLNVMKPTFKTDMWKEWQRLIALSTKTNVKYKNLFETPLPQIQLTLAFQEKRSNYISKKRKSSKILRPDLRLLKFEHSL